MQKYGNIACSWATTYKNEKLQKSESHLKAEESV